MPKFHVLLAVALLITGCSPWPTASRLAPGGSPVPASPSPSPAAAVADSLLYVRMTSRNVMWAETSSRVLRSTDRGLHWTDLTPSPHGESGSFFALDDNTAWFVTILAPGSGSDIYRTTDAGQTWARSGAPLRIDGPGALDFVDRFHGWATVGLGAAAGSEGVAVLQSVDGGASWKRIADTGDPASPGGSPSPSGLGFGCDKNPAAFGTGSVGVLPVECPGGPPFVYRTHDGGFHWTTVDLPQRPGTADAYFANATFLTSTDVILTGSYNGANPGPALLVSNDAGITWHAFSLPGVGAVDFESVSTGWQLDTPIEVTRDGGASWRPLGVPAPPFKPSGMKLQDLGYGSAVAWSSAAVYRTDDWAATWRDITPPQKSP